MKSVFIGLFLQIVAQYVKSQRKRELLKYVKGKKEEKWREKNCFTLQEKPKWSFANTNDQNREKSKKMSLLKKSKTKYEKL